jgi:hypothetical protein
MVVSIQLESLSRFAHGPLTVRSRSAHGTLTVRSRLGKTFCLYLKIYVFVSLNYIVGVDRPETRWRISERPLTGIPLSK